VANGTNVNDPICSLSNNGLTQSLIGVKIEKSIGYGFTAIGQIETGFNPASGEISNSIGSTTKTNTMVLGSMPTFGDGGRDGQLFNGPTFAGLSSPVFGTLTVGRISTLQRDNVLAYDPQGGAYAFSLIGYYGAFSGMGDTEDAFWDNAIKYVYDNGPFHASAAASSGSTDAAQQGAYSFDVGLHNILGGLSIDGSYGKTKDGISVYSQFAPGTTQLLPTVGAEMQAIARATDNTAFGVAGKYVWNLGGAPAAGTYTKAPPAASTFTLYGGWEQYQRRDPTNPVVNGTADMQNYILGLVNNFEYETAGIFNVYWVGGKYAVNNWTFTGAWYHETQNSWLAASPTAVNSGIGSIQSVGAGAACVVPAAGQLTTKAGSGTSAGAIVYAISSNCAGTFDVVSFVVDYAFNKYLDLYTGVNYNWAGGGFLSGLQVSNQVTGVTGIRLKF
jgi:predicted porin